MPEFRQATVSAATRTVLVMNGASWITNNIMISSSRENDPIIDGPLALCLFAFAFDYAPWTITSSESAVAWCSALWLGVFWRSPPLSRLFHAGKLGDDESFARPLSLDNSGAAARNQSPAILRHCWQQHPSVILEPNRVFDRKTCNDIDCHVFLLYRVIDDLAVRSS